MNLNKWNSIQSVLILLSILLGTGCSKKEEIEPTWNPPKEVGWTIYNEENSPLKYYDNGLSVSIVEFDPDGNIWLKSELSTIYHITRSSWEWDAVHWSNSPGVENIAVTHDGTVWFASAYAGLLSLDDEKKWTEFTQSNSGLPTDRLNDIAVDLNGNLWITTLGTKGVIKYDGFNWITYDESNSPLSNCDVKDVIVDHHNNIWFATSYVTANPNLGGIIMFDGSTWTTYDSTNSGLTSKKGTWELAVDADNNLWIGVQSDYHHEPNQEYFGGALIKFDGLNWTVYDGSNSPLYTKYGVSQFDTDGTDIWCSIGPDRGLAHFDGTTWTEYTVLNSELPSNKVACVSVDKFGRKWIGTSNGGLATFK